MTKRLLAVVFALWAFGASAQTFDCTTSCQVKSDPFPPLPSIQPAQCQLFDGSTLLATTSVAGVAGAVYCLFTQQYASGRTVNLTAIALDGAGDVSPPSSPVLTFTSSVTPPPPPPPRTFNIGESGVLTDGDCCNAGLILAQQAVLTQAGNLQSLSFYVSAAAGKLRLGLYANLSTNKPGAKLAEVAEFTPGVGWNTRPVLAMVALQPGTYWLVYAPSANGLSFVKGNGATSYLVGRAYGTLPTAFPTSGLSSTSSHWSFYATLSGQSAPPPPANVCVQ